MEGQWGSRVVYRGKAPLGRILLETMETLKWGLKRPVLDREDSSVSEALAPKGAI